MNQSEVSIKQESVKKMGYAISISGAFLVLINLSGVIMLTMMGDKADFQSPFRDSLAYCPTVDAAFKNVPALGSTMVVVGTVYLIGGIFVIRHKRWASRLITILTALMIIGVWWMMIGMSRCVRMEPELESQWFLPYIVAIAVTIKFGSIVTFLNRKGTMEHFT